MPNIILYQLLLIKAFTHKGDFIMKKLFSIMVIITILCSIAFAEKPRIAILKIEDTAGIEKRFSEQAASIEGRLMRELTQSGLYTVVEREQIDKVIDEQQFNISGVMDESAIIQLGALIGARYVVIGTITAFSISYSALTTPIIEIATEPRTAKVGIDIRIVNIETGEVLIAESGQGSAWKPGNIISVNSENLQTHLGGDTNKIDAVIIDKALNKAVSQCVKNIAYTTKCLWRGVVVKSDGKWITITGGVEIGLAEGMKINVIKIGPPLINPETGENLGREKTLLGVVKIETVAAKTARCKVKKKWHVAVGDQVSLSEVSID